MFIFKEEDEDEFITDSELYMMRSFDDLKEKVVLAMVTNDMDDFNDEIDLTFKTPAQRSRIRKLLLKRQHLGPLSREFKDLASKDLLGLATKIQSMYPALQPRRPREAGTCVEDLVEFSLSTYRCHLVHLAAILGRPYLLNDVVKVVTRRYGKSAGLTQLTARDSQKRSVLMAAVLAGSEGCVRAVCQLLRERSDAESARFALWMAVREMTALMQTRPEIVDTVSHLVQEASASVYVYRDTGLCWAVLTSHLELLQYQVRDRSRGLAELARDRCRSVVDLAVNVGDMTRNPASFPALHWAVLMYSQLPLTPDRREILEYLIHNCDPSPMVTDDAQSPRISPNQVCRLVCKDGMVLSGTAVHFALYPHLFSTLQALPDDTTRLPQPETGFPEHILHGDTVLTISIAKHVPSGHGISWAFSDQPDSMDISEVPMEVFKGVPSSGVLEILEFLHRHGADFSLPDLSGKTPMDILNLEAKPEFVKELVAFGEPCSPQHMCRTALRFERILEDFELKQTEVDMRQNQVDRRLKNALDKISLD